VLARCGEVTLPNSRDINNNDNVSSLFNNQFTEDLRSTDNTDDNDHFT
jgi:hypothetical protein